MELIQITTNSAIVKNDDDATVYDVAVHQDGENELHFPELQSGQSVEIRHQWSSFEQIRVTWENHLGEKQVFPETPD